VNRAEKSWLLPTALVGYVVLSAATSQKGLAWTAGVIPILLALGLRFAARRAEASRLETGLAGIRLGLIGGALFVASLAGDPDNAAMRAAGVAGEGLVLAGVLLCIARQTPPAGLLQGHPAARSLDALGVGIVLFSLLTVAVLLRAIAPDEFPFDPIALDMAVIFSSLGSLLLIVASLLRTKLLRGLEMGVGDRTQAALALAIAGAVVGAGSGLVKMATADRLAAFALVASGMCIIVALATPNAAVVTRTVRGFVALLVLGVPTTLFGAWMIQGAPKHGVGIALGLAALCMLVGLIARSVARPLAPEGSRWLHALTESMTAALHPEPDLALRGALVALRKAEPSSTTRPEVFRFDPPAMLSVDIAGYLTEQAADFPQGVLTYAESEPHRTLRLETLHAAQVRKPAVRPVVTWFEAHRAKTVTVLRDGEGPLGLLVLPRGIRKSALAMEEAELLQALSERLAGLIAVSASLRRSRDREIQFKKTAESASAVADDLRQKLEAQKKSDENEAEARVEILRAAAHSPAAQITLQELEAQALAPTLLVEFPIGVDPLPWAAHAHLYRGRALDGENALPTTTASGNVESEALTATSEHNTWARRPLVIVDLSEKLIRTSTFWEPTSDLSPWRRAKDGTLVLLHPSALPEESQIKLSEALTTERPPLVISCRAPNDKLIPRLDRELAGPLVRLPALADRAEDLQALIINELASLGLAQTGEPYSIDRGAIYELIQRRFPGNDAELTGLVAAAAGHSKTGRVTLEDIRALAQEDETPKPPATVTENRSRARVAPRSRRR